MKKYVAAARRGCVRNGACLLWGGALTTNGRPVMRCHRGCNGSPRAVLWEASGRSLQADYVFARPACDPLCVAPAHQRYVPRAEVMRLARDDGRLPSRAEMSRAMLRWVVRAKPAHVVLDLQRVRQMRERYAELGNVAAVAREFSVSRSQAHRIVTGRQWRAASPFSV